MGPAATPLRRCGPKGSGRFEPVSWSSALDTIARRLQETIDGDGPEAVGLFRTAAPLVFCKGRGWRPVFHRLGASQLARTIRSEAGFEGYLYTIGAAEGMLPEEFAHARLILIRAAHADQQPASLAFCPAGTPARGAVRCTIDLANTRTAQASDEWIALHPGTDGALALAMMHVLVDENRCDADYIARYTLGFDRLVERVRDWTPERAASITGIPAQRIVDLAPRLCSGPASGHSDQLWVAAPLRRRDGCAHHRLPAGAVGAWRQRGGGIQLEQQRPLSPPRPQGASLP
jgi:anaerobic selenocysteine-containing dehydrogenase